MNLVPPAESGTSIPTEAVRPSGGMRLRTDLVSSTEPAPPSPTPSPEIGTDLVQPREQPAPPSPTPAPEIGIPRPVGESLRKIGDQLRGWLGGLGPRLTRTVDDLKAKLPKREEAAPEAEEEAPTGEPLGERDLLARVRKKVGEIRPSVSLKKPSKEEVLRTARKAGDLVERHERKLSVLAGATARLAAPLLGIDRNTADILLTGGVGGLGLFGRMAVAAAERYPRIATRYPRALRAARRLATDLTLAAMGAAVVGAGDRAFSHISANIAQPSPAEATPTPEATAVSQPAEVAAADQLEPSEARFVKEPSVVEPAVEEAALVSRPGEAGLDLRPPREISTPPAPAAPEPPQPIAPIEAPTGAQVSGSAISGTLTYDGARWQIVDNGIKNISTHLAKAVGEGVTIDKEALAKNLQEAADLWSNRQLNQATHPHLWRLFHLSNGTKDVFRDLLNSDTLESLKSLGVVR